MKTTLYKLYASALLLVCGVSSAFAQGYVDDLYYNKNNESHQRSNTKVSRNYNSSTSSGTASSDQPWKKTLVNEGIDTNEQATAKSSSDDYYPGMFAEAVGKNNASEEYKDYNYESDYQPSWYQNTVYVTVVPSWYIGFGFGVSPYYYNPWYASPYYGGYWGNPWYVGYPYGGGWYGWHGGWYNGWYGGGWGYPPYNGGYYPPRYTRSNSVYTGQVRGGSSTYRPSSGRPSSTYTRSGTGQYRPSSTSIRSTTGQYRPASTTGTRNNNTGSFVRPTNTNTNSNTNYNRSNTTTIRNNNTSTTRSNTSISNSSYNRSTSTGTGGGVRSTGGGGSVRTYNRR